jgi:hypothetical protein
MKNILLKKFNCAFCGSSLGFIAYFMHLNFDTNTFLLSKGRIFYKGTILVYPNWFWNIVQ